jgi:hypothetical protein
MEEPPLDSLDVPRPLTRAPRTRPLAVGPTDSTESSAWVDPFDPGQTPQPGALDPVIELRAKPAADPAVPRPVADPATQPVVETMVERSLPVRPPPPPGSPLRTMPGTIQLMKDEDDEVAPGVMVIGPPPSTQPRKGAPAAAPEANPDTPVVAELDKLRDGGDRPPSGPPPPPPPSTTLNSRPQRRRPPR